MSKKRVHEIAKELKSHGIELDNKEVVTELVALGYDVKSHSSSLEDDQAIAAVQKIVEKKKPKAPVAPVAAKGFVVRHKAKPVAAPVEERVEPPPAAPEPPPPPEVAEPVEAVAEEPEAAPPSAGSGQAVPPEPPPALP